MPASNNHPHGTTAYAAPVTFRAPSPASSIGTQYDDDATSDHEANMGLHEFARFCDDKIRLNNPRPEEERAMVDPLVRDKARGQGGEAEKVSNLRAEIKRLDDEEIYERAMMKGSQIGLEYQAPTSDIDKIMRSMMTSTQSLSLEAPKEEEVETQPTTPPPSHRHFPQTSLTPNPPPKPKAPAVTSGPWNNYGHKPASLNPALFQSYRVGSATGIPAPDPLASATSVRSSSTAPTTSFTSTTTTGTNTTQHTTGADSSATEDRMLPRRTRSVFALDERDMSLLSPGSPPPGMLTFGQGWGPGPASSTPMAGSGQTVVGGKRTRNGSARR